MLCFAINLTFMGLTIQANAQSTNTVLKTQNPEYIAKILSNTKDKDPQKPTSQKLNKKQDKKDILNSDQGDLQIDFEIDGKSVKVKNGKKGNTTISIPNQKDIDSVNVVDNKVIYSGKNSKVDTIVESVDGGIRQILHIKDSSAPSFYDFPMSLEPGEQLILTKDGGAQITRPYTTEEQAQYDKVIKTAPQGVEIPTFGTKMGIAKPWAKDANGKDLKTNYSVINGNTLRQSIDLQNAVFPVVADPIWCGVAVNYVSHVFRTYYSTVGQPMYEVSPTWCGKISFSPTPWFEWIEVVDKSPTPLWEIRNYGSSTYWSLFNQYACHSDFINWANIYGTLPNTNLEYRNTYHLEAWRYDRGYIGFVLKGCN
jgi:hypothetical protein